MNSTKTIPLKVKISIRHIPYAMLLYCLLFAQGCTTISNVEEETFRRVSELPRIHSIGNSNILVYENNQPLVIPIKGAYFADETLIWTITAMGVSPLKENTDYVISHPDGFSAGASEKGDPRLGDERSNVIHLTLNKEYLTRVETGDTLSIEVSISDGTEHLALERIHRNDTKVKALLDQLTTELNNPNSDEHVVGKLVSDLVSILQENNNYIAKLRPTPMTMERLALFEADEKAIRTFIIRRKPIPTNLHNEFKLLIRPIEDDSKNRRAESDDNITISQEIPIAENDYMEHSGDIDSWGSLERLLQIIATRHRSMVSCRESQTVRAALLSSATRQFVLYNVSDYRQKVLNSRIPVHDISAYPLPGSETEKLFGKGVAEMYFVVRLSIRNTTEEDQLISTGLIKAYGRALVSSVDSNDTGEEEEVQFTIPVQIVPQSREHVYTIVAEGRQNSPRNIIFRGLELTGTLATALASAFDPSVSSLKWASLYTGIVIPATDKAFSDKIPRNLSNIVNFSMPDLIKVPRNGVIGHKYLFFSKGDLQAIISDTKYAKNAINGKGPVVVYMAFDSLHIPFENTRKPGGNLIELDKANAQIEMLSSQLSKENKKEERAQKKRNLSVKEIERVLAGAKEQKEHLNQLLSTWCRVPQAQTYPGWGLDPDLFKSEQMALKNKIRAKRYIGSGLPNFEQYISDIHQVMDEWKKVFDELNPEQIQSIISEMNNRIEERELALSSHRNQLDAGLTDELNERLMEELKLEISSSGKDMDILAFVAKQISSISLSTLLSDVTDANTQDIRNELDKMIAPLNRLDTMRNSSELFSTLQVPVIHE